MNPSIQMLIGGSGASLIALIGSAKTSNSANSSSLIISKPTGTAQGDLMIAIMNSDAGTGSQTWTGDTGWTEVLDEASPPSLRVAWLIAGASEGSSYTFTFSGATNSNLSGVILTYRNAAYDTIGAINTANPIVAPQITAASGNSVLIGYFCSASASDTFSTPTGMASINNDADANAPSWNVFSQSVNAGATGTRTSTATIGSRPGGVLLCIKPG